MTDLRTAMIQQRINDYYPNARIVSHRDADSKLKYYTEEQLHQLREDWFPLACYKDPRTGKLVFGGRGDVVHTYTIGETGAGKTTRFVMQSLRALAAMPEKPSFLITDMHGEIVENLYTHLKENGYEVRILNCDNPQRSDTYNPFAAMAKSCLQSGEIDDECHNMIRKIAEIIQPVQSNQDPIWDMGARSYTHGCILDKFEDLLVGDISVGCITLYNLIQNHFWLRNELGERYMLDSIQHYSNKPRGAMSVQKILAVTDNAEKTRRSYWGVAENHYDIFGQQAMYRLSSNSTIDVEEFLEKPTAIFVQSGSSTCGDHLISLLVNDIYNAVVRKGKQKRNKKLDRPIHCFLDEFANCHVAEGPVFIKMLTTSRKFGMHWHMLLQSDAQIERKYDKNTGDIVRGNCTEIFFGSYDHNTAIRFAGSCGKMTLESLASQTTQQAPMLEMVDLVTPERLNLMEPGYVFVRSRRHPLLYTYYEAFYNCEEYTAVEDLSSVYPYNDFDHRLTDFTPDDIIRVDAEDMQVLAFVRDHESCTAEDLQQILPPRNIGICVTNLCRMKLLKMEEKRIHLRTNSWQLEQLMERMQQRQKQSPETLKQDRPRQRAPWDIDLYDDSTVTTEAESQVLMDEEPQVLMDEESQGGMDEIPAVFMDDGPDGMYMDCLLHMPIENIQDLKNAADITCLPPSMAELMVKIAEGADPADLRSDVSNFSVLKFEIIEAYITKNDFKTKTQWVKKMREEVNRIVEAGWFNDMATNSFRNALREVDKELTLGNIREIKKIIDGI